MMRDGAGAMTLWVEIRRRMLRQRAGGSAELS
jgi:hypothetical protein